MIDAGIARDIGKEKRAAVLKKELKRINGLVMDCAIEGGTALKVSVDRLVLDEVWRALQRKGYEVDHPFVIGCGPPRDDRIVIQWGRRVFFRRFW